MVNAWVIGGIAIVAVILLTLFAKGVGKRSVNYIEIIKNRLDYHDKQEKQQSDDYVRSMIHVAVQLELAGILGEPTGDYKNKYKEMYINITEALFETNTINTSGTL